jgi:hypothetical protein
MGEASPEKAALYHLRNKPSIVRAFPRMTRMCAADRTERGEADLVAFLGSCLAICYLRTSAVGLIIVESYSRYPAFSDNFGCAI